MVVINQIDEISNYKRVNPDNFISKMSSVPGKAEITQIFKKLRSNPANKVRNRYKFKTKAIYDLVNLNPA